MYEAEDLERMAVEAGFRDVERYGDFARARSGPRTASCSSPPHEVQRVRALTGPLSVTQGRERGGGRGRRLLDRGQTGAALRRRRTAGRARAEQPAACPTSTCALSAPSTSLRTSSTTATSRRPLARSRATTRPSSSSAPSPACRSPTRSASGSACPPTAPPRARRGATSTRWREALRAAGLRAVEELKTATPARRSPGQRSAAAGRSWSSRSTAPAPTASRSARTRPRSRPPSPRCSAAPTRCRAPTASCSSRSC